MARSAKVVSIWETIFLITTYAVPVAFYLYSAETGQGHWFARSGSLMVVMGAMLEYRNFSHQQYLREKRDETWEPDPQFLKALKWRRPFDLLILSSLVIGTVIWGYGDLLFSNT